MAARKPKSKRAFYKYVIAIEVVSERAHLDRWELPAIIEDCVEGESSMRWHLKGTPVSAAKAARLLVEQESSPEFFGLTEDGRDVDG